MKQKTARNWADGLTDVERSEIEAAVTDRTQRWMRRETFEGTFADGTDWRFQVHHLSPFEIEFDEIET